jgi:hypothetical protein
VNSRREIVLGGATAVIWLASLSEEAQPMVDLGRRMLDQPKCANNRLGHAFIADAKIAAGTFGLRAPQSIGWHLDGTERVSLSVRVLVTLDDPMTYGHHAVV